MCSAERQHARTSRATLRIAARPPPRGQPPCDAAPPACRGPAFPWRPLAQSRRGTRGGRAPSRGGTRPAWPVDPIPPKWARQTAGRTAGRTLRHVSIAHASRSALWHGSNAMPRRGMLAAAMAVAAACMSTAVGESSAAPADAPHDLPGVSDMELKQVHVVFRCVLHTASLPVWACSVGCSCAWWEVLSLSHTHALPGQTRRTRATEHQAWQRRHRVGVLRACQA